MPNAPGGTHLSGMLHSSLFLKLSCWMPGKKEPEVEHQSSDLVLKGQVGAPWCHLECEHPQVTLHLCVGL